MLYPKFNSYIVKLVAEKYRAKLSQGIRTRERYEQDQHRSDSGESKLRMRTELLNGNSD